MTKLAVIPARGGSKRIPRKSIRIFRGKPILVWPLRAAQSCGLFDEVMVSTEDQEIADIARANGAAVPFLRSRKTAGDYATTADVLLEVLKKYRNEGKEFTSLCCIYPTAALITPNDLVMGYQMLKSGECDVVVPVTRFSFPILRSFTRTQEGRVRLNFPEHRDARSQDLPVSYHDAGQWYWLNVKNFEKEKVLFGSRTGSIVLPNTQVQDIDSEDDWKIAELKHKMIFG